jgi:hypothetical protein
MAMEACSIVNDDSAGSPDDDERRRDPIAGIGVARSSSALFEGVSRLQKRMRDGKA